MCVFFCAHFVNTLGFSFFFLAFFILYMHFIIFLLIIHFTQWCSVLYTLSACIRFLYFPQSNCVFIAVIYFAVYEQLRCAAVTVGEYWLQSLIKVSGENDFSLSCFMFGLWTILTCFETKKHKQTKQRPATFFSALYLLRSQLQNKYRNITKAHVQQQSRLSDTLSYRMIIRVNLKMY